MPVAQHRMPASGPNWSVDSAGAAELITGTKTAGQGLAAEGGRTSHCQASVDQELLAVRKWLLQIFGFNPGIGG